MRRHGFRGGRPILVGLVLVPAVAAGVWLGASEDAEKRERDSIYKYLTLWEEVLRLVRESYVEEADGRSLVAGAMDGVTDALDPFSVYVPASEVESWLAAREQGRQRSGALVLKERGAAWVVAVDEGSPAADAGLQRGDIVAGINGRSSRDMPLWELRRQFAGPVGAELDLELVRRGDSVEVSLALGEYEPPPPELEEVRGVGVLRIPSFGDDLPQQVKALLDGYGGESLLIDLRGVAGGDDEAAYAVAGLFVDGDLGGLVDRHDRQLASFAGSGGLYSGDVDVLTDRSSQGAAEILTAVLRKSLEADHYGEPTFGWAGTLRQIELPDGGGLLETTAAFYTDPDGERLNGSIRVESDNRIGLFFPGDQEDGSDPVLDGTLDLILETADEVEQL